MITIANISKEYPKIKQDILPEVLKKPEFKFLDENLDLYGQDKTIDEFIDTFVLKLNQVLSKQKKSPVTKKKKEKPLPKARTRKQVSKGRKLAVRKKAKTKVKHKPVIATKPVKTVRNRQSKGAKKAFAKTPAWLAVIRKFTAMANKEFTQATMRTFLETIQKSFDAKKKSDTPHIDIIRAIQLTIVTSVNDQLNKPKVKLVANSGLVSKCKEASRLYTIKKALPSKTKVETKPISGLGFGVIPSQELAKMNFKSLPFTGRWNELIGDPTLPFHLMIYGMPGSGKSTLAIQFSKYLAQEHGLKALYLAREEGISGTTQEKFIRLNAVDENTHITERMPVDLSFYDALFIDSVNEMNMKPDDIRLIQTKYPKLSTIQLFKATKEGKFLGVSDFAHLCQAEVRCLEGKAQAQKNRFGGNKEIEI